MKIFLAGGSGTIGIPLIRALTAAGHDVFATTRTETKQDLLRAAGATPVVVDALDALGLEQAVGEAEPTHVIHQLTALPKDGPRRSSDLAATNRLRIDGTRNLLRASIAAGVTRFIGGSFALAGAAVSHPTGDGTLDETAEAVRSMETQILDAARGHAIEGIVLRYGFFYGANVPSTVALVDQLRRRRVPAIRGDHGQLPQIHLDDAVSATLAALDRGASGAIYEIVDDQAISLSDMVRITAAAVGAPEPLTVPAWMPRLVMPYVARLLDVRVPWSNLKAREGLGWKPRFPTMADGLREFAPAGQANRERIEAARV